MNLGKLNLGRANLGGTGAPSLIKYISGTIRGTSLLHASLALTYRLSGRITGTSLLQGAVYSLTPDTVEPPIKLSDTLFVFDNLDPLHEPSEDFMLIDSTQAYGFSSYLGWATIAIYAMPWNPCSGTNATPSPSGGGGNFIF